MAKKKSDENSMNFPAVSGEEKTMKSDQDLRLELMEKRLEEQAAKMAAMMDSLEAKEKNLSEWEDEIKIRTSKGKKERKSKDEPIPMVLAKFRNFKPGERGSALEFCKQQDQYRLSDNTDYCLPSEIADHLNNIQKRHWEKDNHGNLQPTNTYENMYFVQILDTFWKDQRTGDYYKLENRDGESVHVPYSPEGIDGLRPLKEVK